jgi:hypothetical protein
MRGHGAETFGSRLSFVEVKAEHSQERVVSRGVGDKVVQLAVMTAQAQAQAQKPTGALEQFIQLQAEQPAHPFVEMSRSQNIMLTTLMIQTARTGARFQTASNLAAAHHDIRKNSIANLK